MVGAIFLLEAVAATTLEWVVVLAALAVAMAAILRSAVRFFRRRSGCVCGASPRGCPASRALAALDSAAEDRSDPVADK